MAQAAAENKYGELEEADQEKIKSSGGSYNENYGNFLPKNTFVAASGVFIDHWNVKIIGLWRSRQCNCTGFNSPIALIVLVIATLSNLAFDRKMSKKYGEKERGKWKQSSIIF